MASISPIELQQRLGRDSPPVLLDVREPEEHAWCSLPGSRLVPLSEIHERLADLEDWREKEVVVYCHHGVRSAHAIGLLRAAGFQRLLNLTGGIDRWSVEVDPAVPRY